VGSDGRALSRRRSPYLLCRYGTYFFRVRVPADLVERLGVTEVRRSLGSCDFDTSRLLALSFGTRMKVLFKMLKTQKLGEADFSAYVHHCLETFRADPFPRYVTRTDEPDREIIEQEALACEHIVNLKDQIESANFSPDIQKRTQALAAQIGINFTQIQPHEKLRLAETTARLAVEDARCQKFRLKEGALPYTLQDPLFAERDVISKIDAIGRSSPANDVGNVGPTVAEAIERYEKSKAPTWTKKTLKTHSAKLALLRDYLGPDCRIASVTSEHLWGFVEGLLRLHRNQKDGTPKSFLSRQTPVETMRISSVTAENTFSRTKSFFKWALERGLVSTDPTAAVRVTHPKKQKGTRSRRPFYVSDLTTLFTAPLFTGCKSHSRRFEPGPLVIKDAYYWIIVLGYYTGARIGELVQLHFADVLAEATIPHISINESDPPGTQSSDYKHVKTEAGVRLVPLHPDVMALGFADFVKKRSAVKAKQKRLFHEIKYGADGQASTVMSKWFGRALDKIGLRDPALVFHSFRHGIEDAFRNAKTPQYVIDKIIGHSDGSVASQYGEGVSLEVAHEAMANLPMPISVRALLKFSD
jgi:integrase